MTDTIQHTLTDDPEDSQDKADRDREPLGVKCDVDDCANRIVGLDDGWEFSRGTVCQECIDYYDRHGHWPDKEAEICAECLVDDGAVKHVCAETAADAVLLSPGDECPYCEEVVGDAE